MNRKQVVLACVVCMVVGAGFGVWADQKSGGIALFQGKPAKEAGLAALVEAERTAGKGSWERIGVGRVYYLSGDKTKGQALFDAVTSGKPEGSDWLRIADVYTEAKERDKAEACVQKALAMNSPKDDTGLAEIGTWYIRIGQREKGEELLGRALARNPGHVWHYVRAAEAYLGVTSK